MKTGQCCDTARGPVLVHGFTGSSRSWEGPITNGLLDAGFAPAFVDLPGHGPHPEALPQGPADGSATGASLQAALGVIDRAVRRCASGTGAKSAPVGLVGYSMGGRIALHFAARYPNRVDRLVLESASPGLADPGARATRKVTDERLAQRISTSSMEEFVRYWEAMPLFESQARLPATVRARQRKVRLANDPQGIADALLGLGTGRLPPLWERLALVTIPTLLIVGALDRKFVDVAEQMAERMPNARLAVVGGVGHAVHLENPDGWLAEVTAFLG